jgi:hypothetical protein
MKLTTTIVPMGTRPVASFHWRSAIEGMAETTATFMTSSTVEMHVPGLKTGVEIRSVMSKSSAMKGTMTITARTMTNLIDNILLKEVTSQEVPRLIPETKKGVLAPKF